MRHAGLRYRSPQGRSGEGRVSPLLPLLDDVRHRLRRGASHLPAWRSRQSAHIYFVTDPKAAPATPGFFLRSEALRTI